MNTTEFDHSILENSVHLKPFAVSLTRDPESAKDLCQEAVYRALANREKYQAGTNAKAWLFTITRNIFINEYNRKLKMKSILENSFANSMVNSPVATVDQDAIGSLRLKEIHKAVHRLPQIFKIPFLLYFEGYKYNEISEFLDEPLGTVKSRIHFARKLLKEKLSCL